MTVYNTSAQFEYDIIAVLRTEVRKAGEKQPAGGLLREGGNHCSLRLPVCGLVVDSLGTIVYFGGDV